MIIVRLSGGLGNQMFQYAAGYALSVYHNVSLFLDVNDFAEHKWHNGFGLERIFSCPVKRADRKNVHTLLGWQSWKPIRNRIALPSWRFLRNRRLIVEPGFHCDCGEGDSRHFYIPAALVPSQSRNCVQDK